MKVYIVMCGDFDYKMPDSVWSTREAAMARILSLLEVGPQAYDYKHPWSDPLELEVDKS
jgi:hypothetical protein